MHKFFIVSLYVVSFFLLVVCFTSIVLAKGLLESEVLHKITIDEQLISDGSQKYLYIPETSYQDGLYRVDEYETPCDNTIPNPPVCYGFTLVFFKNDKTIMTYGVGKLKDQIKITDYQTPFVDNVPSSTPQI